MVLPGGFLTLGVLRPCESQMRESRIVAVDHVNLEAPLGVEELVRWFYADLCGLDPVGKSSVGEADEGGDPDGGAGEGIELRFRSEQLEVRIRIRRRPRIESVACRLTIRVEDLHETREQLEERRIPYEALTGVTYSDRRIAVLDPAGNRIELKHGWPAVSI